MRRLQRLSALLDREAENINPGCDGLLTLPYFMGERTPIWDPYARGVFFGLTLNHSAAHLYRSAIEGMAFNFLSNRQCEGQGVQGHLFDTVIRDIGHIFSQLTRCSQVYIAHPYPVFYNDSQFRKSLHYFDLSPPGRPGPHPRQFWNGLERRGDLALFRAVGIRRHTLHMMLLIEHLLMFGMGLICVVISSLCSGSSGSFVPWYGCALPVSRHLDLCRCRKWVCMDVSCCSVDDPR